MIEIKNLHKSFGDNYVLRGVNLYVKDGETLALIGRSGCGKSVLLKHIIGLMKPDKGKILVNGMDVNSRSVNIFEIRKKFGMVFQSSALFDSLTVQENVIIGLREHTNLKESEMIEIASEKLRLVGMSNNKNLKPSELSGGMKKRVGIARALAMDPEYILYDEPTTGLDPIMADRINVLILDLKKRLKKTTIIVTHDMHSAYMVSDRIAMLYEGKIVFDDVREHLLTTKNKFVREFIDSSSIVGINEK
ncbi:MAG TPA: ABC transporter ATP-binding protein [candidate division WOR-3 bacterium]|uniref:ABC transporter ATP-binding protein n=1 Tax=candidate division WOR-3 bacterium TaxID=2052148 RepID=A0A7C5DD78_UNCW3|nr:ABC transporter ATP-binding protein [candidate division WOR-3 bacterium]